MCTGFFSLQESKMDISQPSPPPLPTPEGSLHSSAKPLLGNTPQFKKSLHISHYLLSIWLHTAHYGYLRSSELTFWQFSNLVWEAKSPFSSQCFRETPLSKSRAAVFEGRAEAPAQHTLWVPCSPAHRRPPRGGLRKLLGHSCSAQRCSPPSEVFKQPAYCGAETRGAPSKCPREPGLQHSTLPVGLHCHFARVLWMVREWRGSVGGLRL